MEMGLTWDGWEQRGKLLCRLGMGGKGDCRVPGAARRLGSGSLCLLLQPPALCSGQSRAPCVATAGGEGVSCLEV